MTHEEIWDDTALVDSWNDALEEYKQYHSISARGERVEDVLKNSENQRNGQDGATDYEDEEANELEADELHLKQTFLKATEDRAVRSHDGKSQLEQEQRIVTDAASSHTISKGTEIPQHLIGQIHDEGLKNLLMAWYYAGYYTGLMEGKQPGKAEKVETADINLAKHEA